MARHLLQQLTRASPRRFLSSAASYARVTLDELIANEPSDDRRSKLQSLKALWEEQEKSATYAHNNHATLTIEVLRAKGLNSTQGLFEFLQRRIFDKQLNTHGRRASEAAWTHALRYEPDLEACLRRNLGPSADLPALLVTLHQHLSYHVHAGKDLRNNHGTIVFQGDFLSPEQCSSLVCLGSTVGVYVEPAGYTEVLC